VKSKVNGIFLPPPGPLTALGLLKRPAQVTVQQMQKKDLNMKRRKDRNGFSTQNGAKVVPAEVSKFFKILRYKSSSVHSFCEKYSCGENKHFQSLPVN
jgi:hypothetical protein